MCTQRSVASRTNPVKPQPWEQFNADLPNSSRPTCLRICRGSARRLVEARATGAAVEIFVRRGGLGAVRGDLPFAGVWVDASRRAIAANARAGDCGPAAYADSRCGAW